MIPEVVAEICALAERLGVKNIKDLPRCWEHQVDSRWWFAFNGHREPMMAKQYTVPAYSVVVEFNGWPAGVMDFADGVLAAGEAANEDTFIAAVRAAAESKGQKP